MKKFFTLIPLLLLAIVLFSSHTSKNPTIDLKSFVNTKWHIDDDTIKTSICFKSNNTVWNYYKVTNSNLDSLFLCNWGIENDKIYLCSDAFIFSNMTIISCNKQVLIINFTDKNECVKFHRITPHND